METHIKAGDVVVLKSGSQKMVVEAIQGSLARILYEDDLGSLKHDDVAVAALREAAANE